jgi:SAM-dependent methyltransferase
VKVFVAEIGLGMMRFGLGHIFIVYARRMSSVEQHYAQPGLMERVQEALSAHGLDPEKLDQGAVERLDQFHAGGLEATDWLIRLAGIQKGDRVLDLGSGIGGPSRHLASTVGCHVTGLDLTAEYCEVATMMARSTGLAQLLDYQQGDALHTPFADESFDVVWTQHASMNIEDKSALYREMFRLVKRGGKLAVHDIIAGSGDIRYPVPWARTADLSFLSTEDGMIDGLKAAGFHKSVFLDVTKEGLDAIRVLAAKAPSQGFGLATLMGPEFPGMVANLAENLHSGICRIIQAVFLKPLLS